MAHYAYIDKQTNKVVMITVGKDESEVIDGLDTETYYAQGTDYLVKRTSYNKKIRGNYAAINDLYLAAEDIFIKPQCHPEAVLNAGAAQWDCNNDKHKLPIYES